MSQWAYVKDENGDLVNLHKMEAIQLSQPDPDSEVRTVMAVPPGNGEEGYVLFRGEEEMCTKYLENLFVAIALDI